jgi:membrane-bound metal-dependent hydrolase YbcI (DUF457 family)
VLYLSIKRFCERTSMPNYKGHLVGGFVAFLIALKIIVVQKVSFLRALEWLCFTLLGALFPDIDIKSKGQRIFYTVMSVVCIFLFVNKCFYALTVLCFISFIPLLVRHRGLCHEVWFVIGVPLCSALIISFFSPTLYRTLLWDALFFIIGALSHVYLDVGLKRMLKI